MGSVCHAVHPGLMYRGFAVSGGCRPFRLTHPGYTHRPRQRREAEYCPLFISSEHSYTRNTSDWAKFNQDGTDIKEGN